MKAALYKGNQTFSVEEIPTPKPNANEVLIKVYAAGINRPDIMQRQGNYPPPKGASPIPGLEISGVIAKVDPTSSKFKIGEKVCALVTGGGYAGYCIAPEAQTLRIPNNLSMIESAALPETFFTVWANLFHNKMLSSGESILESFRASLMLDLKPVEKLSTPITF